MHPSTVSRGRQQKVFDYCRSSDFSEVSQSPSFVDKTLFIKSFFESKFNYCLIVAPPGYGKSTNLDMVKRFVEIDVDPQTGRVSTFNHSKNYRIFKKTNPKIYQDKQFFKDYFAKFPVIYLSLKNVYAKTLELLIQKYAENLTRSFRQHHYLTKSDKLNVKEKKLVATYTTLATCKKLSEEKLQNGVQFLAEMLAKHYMLKEVIVLIDDFDYPFIYYMVERSSIDESSEHTQFIRQLFLTIVESTGPIVRGLFMNRTELFPRNIRNHENVKKYAVPFCDVHHTFFGLTVEEVCNLLKAFGMENYEAVNKVLRNYGYASIKSNPAIFCTSAVMEYLDKEEMLDFRNVSDISELHRIIETYLSYSPVTHLIDRLITMPHLRHKFLLTYPVTCAMVQLRNVVAKCLWYYGCLEITDIPEMGYYGIRIANQFIRRELKQLINRYYGDELNQQLERCAELFNQIKTNPPPHFYYNFIEEFRKISIKYSKKFPTERYASIQCMADIMSKTPELYNREPITVRNFPSKICNIYENILNQYVVNGIGVNVEYDISIELVLAAAVNMTVKYEKEVNSLISVGISTDAKFRYAIGWVVGKDLKNAQYFSFK